MPPSEVKSMEVAEFRKLGFLQELNRRFLHPLGLALEVAIDDDGNESFGQVWDCRDDPEGIYFDGDYLGQEAFDKAGQISRLWREREQLRREHLGYMIQPLTPEDTNERNRRTT